MMTTRSYNLVGRDGGTKLYEYQVHQVSMLHKLHEQNDIHPATRFKVNVFFIQNYKDVHAKRNEKYWRSPSPLLYSVRD